MDCAIACGTSIAAKIAEYTVVPVGRQLGYIFLYRRNVRNLNTETKDMNVKKEAMEKLVVAAKDSGDEIYAEIDKCLTDVRKITEDAQNLIDNTNIKCSLRGSFSYLAARYRLSMRAKKMRESVVEIKAKIRFDNISFRPKLKNIFETKDYLNSATREKFVDGIREVLGDSNIRTIGIHGMPGAGKTTLVTEIARKALSKDWNLFDDAVIVTVSQTPILEKIQQQIAERLRLKFDGEMIAERALQLRHRMKREEKFLIILDDIWNDKLKLEEVGIVFESDKKGCKVLMTSRFGSVLDKMGVDKNSKVDILSEDEARNWFEIIVGDAVTTRGFKEIGNKIVKKCGCLPLAIVTVANSLKNCDLPTWRDTLRQLERSKHDEIVHSAIKLCYDKLESDEAKKLLLLCALHEEDANIKMEYLMRYGWGIDMLKNVYTLQEARDRVSRWVKLLKERCLLLDGDSSGTVKLHDVIRDIAISIAKESHDMHWFRDGREVVEFLKDKKFEDLKAISLPNGYLEELVFERSEYTQLQLMICIQKESSNMIPGDFLDRIKHLRVLDFSGKVLASHLSPLQNLRTLRLCDSDVEDVAEIGKLNSLEILDLSESYINKLPGEIGQLTRLRMLDLRGCYHLEVIEPNAILHLKRLEELYVDKFRNWHKVDQVENGERSNAGFDELKHLVHLTALHIHVSDIEMLPKVLLSQKLERYDIRIGTYNYDFSQYSSSRRLLIEHTDSSLLREHGFDMLMKRSEELWLKGLNGVNNIVSELDTEGFPELKSLSLESDNTIQYLVNYSMGKIHSCIVFGSLETLNLYYLSNLKQICHGEVTAESFKTLRVVTVSYCNSLKKLLPLFNVRQLEEIEIVVCEEMEEIFTHQIQEDNDDNKEELLQLRSLKLFGVSKLKEFCSKRLLKEIGSTSQNEEEPFVGDSVMPLFNGKFLCFPKLEILRLSGCHVKKLWDDQLVPSSTSFCCLTKLVVDNCKHLKCVFSCAMAVRFEQLISVDVRYCETMEEIMSRSDERMDNIISFPKLETMDLYHNPNMVSFSKTSEGSSLFDERVAFPNLESLSIIQLNGLKMIWQYGLCNNIADSFCKLEKVQVLYCKNLMGIFPSGMHTRLGNLKQLVIRDCQMVEEIFQMETSNSEEIHDSISTRLYSMELSQLSNLKYVWSKDPQGTFTCPNLDRVFAYGCPNLKAIFPPSVAKHLSRLTILRIINCGIEEVIGNKQEGLETVLPPDHDDEFVFPQLQIMELKSLPNLVSFYAGTHTVRLRFPLLEQLEVADCLKVKAFSGSELLSFQGRHESLQSTKVTFGRDLKCKNYVNCQT